MRIRFALLCSLAVGATWWLSGAASALDVGPVSVPVPLPDVTVTVPPAVTVGPVSVPVANAAPGLGAAVTASPQTGVGASVSLPSSIAPLPVLSGRTVTAPATVQPGTPSSPAAPPRVSSGASGSRAAAASRGAAGPASQVAPIEFHRAGVARASSAPSRSAALQAQPGVVSASLQHQSPGGVWSLLHDLASARGLWIMLLLIVAIARFAAGGLLRDAFRRRANVSST